MHPNDFKASPSGTLIPTVENQWAFIPNSLPPEIDAMSLMEPLQSAALELGNLNGTAKLIKNPYLVIRPLQRLEALLSSAMEGTYTTANALALAEADSEKADPSTREVLNYIRAYETAQKLLEKLPISNRVIKAAHEILLSDLHNTRGKNPGEFKDHQNFIGGRTRKIQDARFVPPPPNETIHAMGELEKYINHENGIMFPPLINAALIHYQFETIHPFSDGNGRIGRMLIPMYLMERKMMDVPILYVSPVVEGRKDEYVDRMLAVSQNGEWNQWINFFLEVVEQSCAATNTTINKLLNLNESFRKQLVEINGSAKLQSLVDALFDKPVITIPKAAEMMQTSYPTAASGIQKLVQLGILEELDYTQHPKEYMCVQVVSATDPDLV